MSQVTRQRYSQRGVSASKEDVHNAIKNIDKGLFPNAFCKIVPDYLTNDPNYCIVMHADGAGTMHDCEHCSRIRHVHMRNSSHD